MTTWRNIRLVMLLTAHVAFAAFCVRLVRSGDKVSFALADLVVVAMISAVTWSFQRLLFYSPYLSDEGPICPRCGSWELRPLIRAGRSMFEDLAARRCRTCGITLRLVDGKRIIEPPRSNRPVSAAGITFVEDRQPADEIRFLEEPNPEVATLPILSNDANINPPPVSEQ